MQARPFVRVVKPDPAWVFMPSINASVRICCFLILYLPGQYPQGQSLPAEFSILWPDGSGLVGTLSE